IAQGDFVKLLHASTDERVKIFRKIFNTKRFSTLQDCLSQDTKAVDVKCQELKRQMAYYVASIQGDEAHQLQIDSAKEGLLLDRETMELLEDLNSQDEARSGTLLKKQEDCAEELKLLTQQETRETERLKGVKALEIARLDLEKVTSQLKEKQGELGEIHADSMVYKTLEGEIAALEAQLSRYDQLEQSRGEQQSIQAEKKKVSGEIVRLTEKIQMAENQLTLDKQQIENLGNPQAEEARQASLLEMQKETAGKLMDVTTDLQRLETLKQTHREEQEAYRKLADKADGLMQEWSWKNRAFLDQQAGILSTTLAAGQPCPVCGSTEHPSPALCDQEAPSEQDVERANKAATTAQKEAKKASSQADKTNGILEELETALMNQGKNLLPDVAFGDLKQGVKAGLTACEGKLAETKSRLTKATQARVQLEGLTKSLPEKEEQLGKYVQAHTDLEHQQTTLSARGEALEQQLNTMEKQLAYPDKKSAQTYIQQSKKRVETYGKQLSTAQTACQTLEANVASLQGRIEALVQPQKTAEQVDMETITAQIRANKIAQVKMVEESKTLHTRLTQNREISKQLDTILTERDKEAHHLQWMTALSKTVNGTLVGKERMALETFVQTTYFDRVLSKANVRLMAMSGGKYDLMRQKSSGLSGQVGLDLDVFNHHNGAQLSVKTLSGGESFMASLSLALGLADEIQSSAGGIQLDTMFIDEGFGALDDDALRQAMAVLNGLGDGHRLVGIISHVAALKEQIEKQILVKKHPYGSSYLEIQTI
ncbi:MAG: SMC family ATPase, partial [Eubacteriales bacterium]